MYTFASWIDVAQDLMSVYLLLVYMTVCDILLTTANWIARRKEVAYFSLNILPTGVG